MDDRLDEAFRELGRGLPFEVDWEAYERRMLTRLHRARTGRRRAAAWWLLTGLAGSAASVTLASSPSQGASEGPPSHPRAAATEVAAADGFRSRIVALD